MASPEFHHVLGGFLVSFGSGISVVHYLTMTETLLLCLINGGYDLITDEFYMEKTYHFKVKTHHQGIDPEFLKELGLSVCIYYGGRVYYCDLIE